MSSSDPTRETQVESGAAEIGRAEYGDYFAEQQTTPTGRWLKRRARQRQQDIIQGFVPDRKSAVLEIGPGFGELTALFLDAGYNDYTVVEPNSAMRTRLAPLGVRTRDYSIPMLDETDESYDVLLLFHVFEHLKDSQEAQLFISEAHRVLRPRGHLCILSPDYLHWQHDFFNGDYSHSNVTTVRRTIQLLHDGGLETVAYAYFSGFVTGPFATCLSMLVRCSLAFTAGNALDSKLYKLKTTLLRSFLIIGRKVTARGNL